MSKLRVHSFAISIDGFGAGPNQDLQNPLGVNGEDLMEWFFNTRDNSATLDPQRFTVFGNVALGATVLNQIQALPTIDATGVNPA